MQCFRKNQFDRTNDRCVLCMFTKTLNCYKFIGGVGDYLLNFDMSFVSFLKDVGLNLTNNAPAAMKKITGIWEIITFRIFMLVNSVEYV